MKKNVYLIILTLVTVICIIGGTCYHLVGWGVSFLSHLPFVSFYSDSDDTESSGTTLSTGTVSLPSFNTVKIDSKVMNLSIEKGELVGTKKDQDLMAAGNAIERSHKNISEIANFMLSESHFPYVLFLEGSNFLTETVHVTRPDGRVVTLEYNSGMLNRLDRLTAANYGMPINTNLCKNKFVQHEDKTIMLQAASIYTQGNGRSWDRQKMFEIMFEVAETSLQMLGRDLWNQMKG